MGRARPQLSRDPLGGTDLHAARLVTSLIAITGLLSSCAALNPARRSEVEIRQSILARTPPGSSIEFARTALREYYSHECTHGSFTIALSPERPEGPAPYTYPQAREVLVGCVGWYYALPTPLRFHVYSYWVFGESGALLDVVVKKFLDAP